MDPSFLFLVAVASVVLRHPDDAELVERLKNRDPEAMGELYDRYGKVAFSVIVRIVGDRAVAEDLLQESLLRVWNRVRSFDGTRGALGPWLLAVARNQAIDYKRSLQGRAWQSAVAMDLEHPGAFRGLEDQVLASLQVDQVRAALAKLNENQRTVIELAYFEGLSHSEMADRIQQPLGTVKTWVRTALRTLREELRAAVTA